jgi:hypothetical protein
MNTGKSKKFHQASISYSQILYGVELKFSPAFGKQKYKKSSRSTAEFFSVSKTRRCLKNPAVFFIVKT